MNNHKMNYTLNVGMAQCLATYSDNAAFIRVCHPLPFDLKNATISASSRRVICFFGLSNGGRPLTVKLPSFCALINSAINGSVFASSLPRLALAKKSSPNSIKSPLSSYLFFFGIFPPFSLVGFSQADNADSITTNSKREDVQPATNKAHGIIAVFPVITAAILFNHSIGKPKARNRIKPDTVFQLIALVFIAIKLNVHCLYCNYKNITRQVNKDQQSPTRTKKHLTRKGFIGSIESLTKTRNGHRTRQTSGFFMPALWAYSRLYDGLRRPNKTPSGNKSRRLRAVSEARHLNMVALSKTRNAGGQNYA